MLRLVTLAQTGTSVKSESAVVEFDPADQQYTLEQEKMDLAEAEQNIVKIRADAAVQVAQDEVALLTARFDVRRGELDATANEFIGAMDAEKNKLSLEEARRRLAQLQEDVKSRTATNQASLAVALEKRNKALLSMQRAQQVIDSLVIRAPFDGVVSVKENRDASGGMIFYGMILPEYRAGDQIWPGRPVVDVIESGRMEVRAKIDESDRPNLVARLRGADDGPTLCLLSHVDTVLADPSEWQREPWSGDVVDGELWGRGAQDMKSQTAAEVVAAVALAREGWRPDRGDLLVVSVVDEETGGGEGAEWLTEHHPDAVRCDLLLNEGAGAAFPFGDERVYGVCVAEKGVFRFMLTTDGVAAHASTPNVGDNALLKMVPLLQAIGERRPGFDVTDPPRALLDGLGIPLDGDPAAALGALRDRDPRLAATVEPMLGVTLAPTIISASEKINVIPSRACLQIDCRTPPGMGEEQVRTRVHELLGGAGYALEFTEKVVGNAA